MNYKADIIGIHSDNSKIESEYVPFLSFKNQEQKKVAENYIYQEVSAFFEKILPSQAVMPIPYTKLITEADFKKKEISYFYENLFYDLERKPNGKLEAKIRWGITFDKNCTPLQLASTPPNVSGFKKPPLSYIDTKGRPHRQFGTIDINGTPVFYYIYFTLQEILDVIKRI
jgi:hypothetical protein